MHQTNTALFAVGHADYLKQMSDCQMENIRCSHQKSVTASNNAETQT